MQISSHPSFYLFLLLGFSLLFQSLSAAELTASDGVASDLFGYSVSQSGSIGLLGAYGDANNGSNSGSAYLFRNLDTATGTITQNAKLTASDGAAVDRFGYSVSQSGSIGLVGAYLDDDNGSNSGSAYLFRNLDTATGSITQNAKLTASDGASNDYFGLSLSQSGDIGLVGAYGDADNGFFSGSAYVFRDLDTATGSITQNAKLTASDGAIFDSFGYSMSHSGSIGLVGAYQNDENGSNSGSAYLFRNLDTATGSITQNAKLTASDGAADDYFGYSVSQSGSIGLVGAFGDDDKGSNSGSAYLFRNLDTATGSITQNAKLAASDGATEDRFAHSVSQSGSLGLVGAYLDDDNGADSGSAYLFRNLDTATGTVTESVKLLASDGAAADSFGRSVSVDGDKFTIGASAGDGATIDSGKAYTGSVSSLTTLDEGASHKTISGISFISRENWIIGETTDSNQVTLSVGDTATVAAAGKEVYIGMNAGSDGNTLEIQGNLIASIVNIGAETGTEGNQLRLVNTATIDAVSFIMGENSSLAIEGDHTADGALLAYLGDTELQVWNGTALETLTTGNQSSLIESSFTGGYTTFTAIPEPSAALLSILSLLALLRRSID